MTIIYVKGPDGNSQPFKIAGATPSDQEQARINSHFAGLSSPKAKPEDTPGILTELARGIGRGIDQTQAGILTAGQGVAENSESGTLFGLTAEDYRKAAEEQRRQAATLPGPQGSFFEQDGLYDKSRFLAATLGESIPAMVGGVAATIGGAAAGTATGGPVGGVVGGVGGALAASAFYAPQLLNENAERQIEQHGYIKDWGKAVGSTAANAMMESVADRLTLGVAGVLKKPVSVVMRQAIKSGVEKSTTIAARQIGGAAAVGAVSEAGTEALQALTTRWQAGLPLGDDAAQAEYLENAVVAGILGGTFGGVFGTAGAHDEIRARRGYDEAVKDAAAERSELGRRRDTALANSQQTPPPADPGFVGMLEDKSAPSTEQLMLGKNGPVNPSEGIAVETQSNAKNFSEEEYRTALEMVRDDAKVAPDKIKSKMNVGRVKAQALFDEMLRRNDASPAGSANQYLKVTVPKGMATRENSNISGDIKSSGLEREFAIGKVDDAARTPYSIKLNDGRELKEKFTSQDQAQKWAIGQKLRNFSVEEDLKGQRYGIYEKYYKGTDGERRLVGNRIVNTYNSLDDANAGMRDYNPQYSAQTNAEAQRLAEEERVGEIKRNVDKNVQDFVDTILGAGRARVEVPDTIDNSYLTKRNMEKVSKSFAIEGATIPRQEDLPQIISAARSMIDPSLTEDQQTNELKAIAGGHEMVHAIRNSDLLTKKEWNSLTQYAMNNNVPGKKYTWAQKEAARHPNNPAVDAEEMIAEMFRHYVRDPMAFDKQSRGMFQKMVDFIKKFLRLAGDDGSDLMKAIYGGALAGRTEGSGGMGVRNYPGNPKFSTVQVDPFYSQAERFFQESKQEKASPEQWLGMIRNSNIKKEELTWLDLENWFKAFNNQPVKRGDILDYIRASSLRPVEEWMGDLAPGMTVGEDAEFQELDRRLGRIMREGNTWSGEASWTPEDDARWNILRDKIAPVAPFVRYTQEGADGYGVVLFTLPHMEPEFVQEAHYAQPNVIATSRFTSRDIDGHRTLFIEEIQSDLHQSAAKVGGYGNAFVANRGAQIGDEVDLIDEEISAVQAEIEEHTKENPDATNDDVLDDLANELGNLQTRRRAVVDALNNYNQRADLPDAPLKTTWEEFVLKRLIRYAAENDFDYIGWHGEGDSVALSEQHLGYRPTKTPIKEADPTDLEGRVGNRQAMQAAYEKALEANDKTGALFIETMTKAYDRGENIDDDWLRREMAPQVIDTYFPARSSGGVKHLVEGQDMTTIYNRYIEKLPRIARNIGKKFGAIPQLFEPKANASAEVGPFDVFENAADINSFLAQFANDMPYKMEEQVAKLGQMLYHRYQYDTPPADVMTQMQESIGFDTEAVKEFLKTNDPQYAQFFGDPEPPIQYDENGNPLVKRWMMPLTDDLKEQALTKGFPTFSAVDPNEAPNDQGFEVGTKISMLAVPGDDNTDPIMPDMKFSAIEAKPLEGKPYETMVNREVKRIGYNAYTRQKLAKAKIYDKGMTPYGKPLEVGEPAYAKDYITRIGLNGRTPVFGSVVNPNTNKQEPVVFHAGADWRAEERGIAWPTGYGFNHSVWHHETIAKDTGESADPMKMLVLFAKTISRGGELAMDRGNMGIITYQGEGWKKPLKIVLQRTMVTDDYFKNKPVWKFITAYTNDVGANLSAVAVDDTPRWSAAAPMGQRVPLVIPVATLTDVENKMTYNNLAPVLQKLGARLPENLKIKYDSGVEGTFIALQDRMQPVGKLIDRLRKNNGFISNETDTYLRETLFAGQADEKLQAAHRNLYTPLANAVKALGVTQAQRDEAVHLNESARTIIRNYTDANVAVAEMYLYAQHAIERNAEMRYRNEKLSGERPLQAEAGSGMTDEEATEILSWVGKQSFAKQLNDYNTPTSVRSLMRKLISDTNDTRVEGQLNPDFRQMQYEDGTSMDRYTDYVPLRSWVDEHLDDDNDVREFAKTGKGFRVMGKEDFSATGRRSLGSDLMAHAVLQNEEAIVRSGKNEVGLSFLNLVRDNPQMMADVAEVVHGEKMKYVYDKRSGRVRRSVDNTYRFDDSVLTVKEDGSEVHVKIKDPRIAKAMNQRSSLGNNGAGALMKYLLGLNRYLAAVRTSYNPEFMVGNFMRDLQAALANISEHEMAGLKKEIVGNIFNAAKGVREGVRNKTADTEWGKTFRDFRERGGMTAFYGIRDLDDTIAKMNKEMSQDLSGTNLAKVWKAVSSVGDFIEGYNSVVENAVRVSTYKAVRDRLLASTGDPKDTSNIKRASERAAFIAKELTVNFNRGGDAKPLINALYLFFNASLQGSMALINPMLRSKKVRRLWGSVMVAGLLQDVLMGMLSPEDEDGIKQYDKIPEFILEHNIVFMDPFGISERGYFKIPIPYLMNGFYNAGRGVSAALRGKYTVGEAFNSIGGTMVSALNPWGEMNSFLNFVAPTIADPIVDLARNENFANDPIAPPENPFGGSEKASQRYWNNTSPLYVTIADWLSRLSGSDGTYLPGSMEYSPNQIEYVFDFIGGGAATFARRAFDFASPVGGQKNFYEMMTGNEWDANDVPVFRRFYGNVTTRNDLQYYIENRDKILAVRQEMKDAIKRGDSEHYKNIILTYPEEYRLASKINSIENSRKKISSQINKIRESKLPEAEKTARIKLLKAKQDDIIGRANAFLRG